jgi:ribosomal protein S18 acetylase RimI-like enzyme
MINNRIKQIVIIAGITLATCGGFTAYYYHKSTQGPISDFNPLTDMQPVLAIFNKDFDWLTANKDSSPAFMFRNRTYDNNPIHFGMLKIKVLREGDKIAGFTSYYMEQHQQGRILFVAVGHEFRGKGYGKLLTQYAMNELFKMGADHLALWTRVDNFPAQKIYKGLGFVEVFDSGDGFVFFECHPHNH